MRTNARTHTHTHHAHRWAAGHDLAQRVAEVSGLAGVVIDVASRGDAVADTILKHGVGELFRSAKAVSTKLGLERSRQPYKLVLAGAVRGCGAVRWAAMGCSVSDVLMHLAPVAEERRWGQWCMHAPVVSVATFRCLLSRLALHAPR